MIHLARSHPWTLAYLSIWLLVMLLLTVLL